MGVEQGLSLYPRKASIAEGMTVDFLKRGSLRRQIHVIPAVTEDEMHAAHPDQTPQTEIDPDLLMIRLSQMLVPWLLAHTSYAQRDRQTRIGEDGLPTYVPQPGEKPWRPRIHPTR